MKLKRLWAWLLSLITITSSGCIPGAQFVDTTVHGVPNMVQIAPRLWRMGQPADVEAWNYVGVTLMPASSTAHIVIVKLNDEAEGSDDPAVALGMMLLKRPIPPEDDKPWTVLEKPDPKMVWSIVGEIVDAYNRGDTVVVHCVHGRDRTSLLIALAGMKLFGWSKEVAWKNMLDHGFRWELPDLDAFWLENVH